MSMKKSLADLKSSKERRNYAAELMGKIKSHIPIVLQPHKNLSFEIPDANKVIMVSNSLKMMNFLKFLRMKVQLEESAALFLFAENKYLVKTGDLMGEVYAKYRNEDGFLYLNVSEKEIWG